MQRRVASLVAWLGAVSSLAAGCGTSEDAGVAAVTREQYPGMMAGTVCGKQETCECETNPACRATLERSLIEEAAYFEEQGLVYDPSCAGHAIDEASAQTCDGYWTNPVCQPCSVFHGTVADGGTCQVFASPSGARYDDCAPGLTCSPHNSRCAPKCPGAGDYCDDSSWCGENAYCSDPTGGICLRYTAVGQACERGSECITGNCVEAVCQEYPDVGQPCDGVCRDEAICLEGVCAAPGRQGAACQSNYFCADGFYCDVALTCQPQKLRGEACVDDPTAPDPCAQGLFCNGTACEPYPANICY